MASRQHYLAIEGVRDVAHFLAAFQHLNTCILWLSLSVMERNHRPDLTLLMEAYTPGVAPAEGAPLASVKLELAAENFRTLDAAIMFSLYKLDYALAQVEMEGEKID